MAGGTKLSIIPQRTKVLYDTYAAITALTASLKAGDLAFATDTNVLYRWSGVALQPITTYTSIRTIVSDLLQHSHDPPNNTCYETYNKGKIITLSAPLSAVRVKFDLKNTDGVTTVYGRIYKNDIAFGTEQSTANNAYQTFSEDLADLAINDELQLWRYTTANAAHGGSDVYSRNLRLYYNLVLPAHTNS